MWRPTSGVGRVLRYITYMVTQTHRIKRIVTALFLAVGFSLPAHAQEAALDGLYQDLLDADAGAYAGIEAEIFATWDKSRSPAMDLLLQRGEDALLDGNPQAAVDHYTALIDHAPHFAGGYFGRASAYYLIGLTGPALGDIARVLQIDPRQFRAIEGLAVIMEDLERTDDALELYEMILAINPQSLPTKDAVARLQLQLEGQAL
jgi:tetratricopeptide (TPR) repeat protein